MAVYSACVFLAPSAGIPVTPAILPLFIAKAPAWRWLFTFVRLSVLRLSPLRPVRSLAQKLPGAPCDPAVAPWATNGVLFRRLIATSIGPFNFQPLTPLTFLELTAAVFPRSSRHRPQVALHRNYREFPRAHEAARLLTRRSEATERGDTIPARPYSPTRPRCSNVVT